MNNFELLLAKELSGGGAAPTLITKNITANGTYTASDDSADGYSSVSVDVPNSYTTQDEGKVVSNGALVAQTSTTVSQNGTVNTTANNQVVVDVPNTYTQADEGKVVSNGALISQTVYPTTITENGTYDTTTNNSVTVEISSNNNICAMLYDDSNFSTTSKVSLSVFNNNALTVLVGGYGNANTKTYYINPNEILLSNYFLEDDVITGTGYSPTSGTTQAAKVTVSCKMKVSTNTVVISKSSGGTGSNVYFACYNY